MSRAVPQRHGPYRAVEHSVYRAGTAVYRTSSQGNRGAGGRPSPFFSISDDLFLRNPFFTFLQYGLRHTARGGDSRHPLLYLAVASIVNIILDFTFVCGFHMGIAGVAIATIMAQAVSSFMVMHKLMHTREDYKVEIRKIRFHKKMIRKIIAFGFPAACQQSITSFSNVVVQSYINRFGTAAMAGYSATLRIDGFLQLPLQSFNMAITTFVGQNIGARKYKRVKKGIFCRLGYELPDYSGRFSGNVFRSPLLISVFTNDPQVIGNGSSMLRIFSRAYIVMPVIQVLNGALRGAGLSRSPCSLCWAASWF